MARLIFRCIGDEPVRLASLLFQELNDWRKQRIVRKETEVLVDRALNMISVTGSTRAIGSARTICAAFASGFNDTYARNEYKNATIIR